MASPPVLLVSSTGGRLAQLWPRRPRWSEHERLWITFRALNALSPLSGATSRWTHRRGARRLRGLLRNSVLAVRVFARHRPAVVVSTGATVALPFLVLARLMGVPTVRVRVDDRIDTPTLTALLCHPVNSLFLAQWREPRGPAPTALTVGPPL